ncbi:hypothetical protein [Nocardioides sp. AE5]|uniref:hypothetical protein n=1 Tax=Nocardioides sp. AE5 TaxID=2962573 RepID=UPI002882AB38|nr:hypothetical protein [Nocardioides sp. AE5]MDT0203067.1 hypothetical protein [Nocardioides sp. AE5]
MALVTACGDGDSDDSGPKTPTTPGVSISGGPETTELDPTDPGGEELPPSTVEDWVGFITDAGGTNGVAWALDQTTTAVACLPENDAPTCALAAMSGQFFAQQVSRSFSGALGEGDVLSNTDPIGAPPAEIADLVVRTRDAGAAYDQAVKGVTGSAGGEDCTDNVEEPCAAAREAAATAGQEFLDMMAEWEPRLG